MLTPRNARLIRLAYLAVILLATLSYMRLDPEPERVARRLRRMLDPSLSRRAIVDGARNVALFAGWGLLWMLTAAPGRAWPHLRAAALTGFALSSSVELVQLMSASRVASLFDVASNTAGALLGAVSVPLAVRWLDRVTSREPQSRAPAAILALPYACAVFGEAFAPLLRQNMRVRVSGGLLERMWLALQAFDPATLRDVPLEAFLLFAPAGLLGAMAMMDVGLAPKVAALRVSLLGTVLAVVAEVAHGIVSVPVHGGAMLIHALAVATGACSAAVLSRWLESIEARTVAAAYALVLVLWAVRPFDVETSLAGLMTELRSDWWIPFGSLRGRNDVFSVVDVLNGFFLYLPLGAFLAASPGRTDVLSGLLPAVGLAIGTEIAQLAVMGRALDVTDAAIQASATCVGWALARRSARAGRSYERAGSRIPAGESASASTA